jgi:hypothetical protein
MRDILSAFGGIVSGRQDLIPFTGISRRYFIKYRIR